MIIRNRTVSEQSCLPFEASLLRPCPSFRPRPQQAGGQAQSPDNPRASAARDRGHRPARRGEALSVLRRRAPPQSARPSPRNSYAPAQLKVLQIRHPKYACRSCGGQLAVAPLPPQDVEQGIAAPGLLAHVLEPSSPTTCPCITRKPSSTAMASTLPAPPSVTSPQGVGRHVLLIRNE